MGTVPIQEAQAAGRHETTRCLRPSRRTGRTGLGPANSSAAEAAGCQYIRISLPQGSLRPGAGDQVVRFLAHHGERSP